MTVANKVRILNAFDTLNAVVEFVGSAKGATSKCGECGHLANSPGTHPGTCSTNAAISALSKIVPQFSAREEWLRGVGVIDVTR